MDSINVFDKYSLCRLRVWLSGVLSVAVLSTAGTSATAETPSNTVSAYLGAEGWGIEDQFGHGFFLLGYEHRAGSHRVDLEYNTDTLTATYSYSGKGFQLGAIARGQYRVAGLLTDYYRGGERIAEYGFGASYVQATTFGRLWTGRHTLGVELSARHWFFDRDGTADRFILPQDHAMLESAIGYTYWNLSHDPSFSDRHRVFERLDGFAWGVRLTGTYRTRTRAWGIAIRNRPWALAPGVEQWVRAGVQYAPRLRLQLRQRASWAFGHDDLTRARLGGMNPYVVPISGAPWAAFLSSRFGAFTVSHHVKIGWGAEWVSQVDGALIWDVERDGRRAFGPVLGLASGFDVRVGSWQVDARLGASPDTGWQQVAGPIVSGYAGLGRSW